MALPSSVILMAIIMRKLLTWLSRLDIVWQLLQKKGWNDARSDFFTLRRIGVHQDMTSTKAMFGCRIAGIFQTCTGCNGLSGNNKV
jgi:hypothetical protein